MAESEEMETNAPKVNEWEVVSLSASAYAASPGTSGIENEAASAETSSHMFMSGHFVFPPSQHENLPLEPKYDESTNANDASRQVNKEAYIRVTRDEEHLVEARVSRDFPAIPIFDEKGNFISINALSYEKKGGFDEEQHSTSIEGHASGSSFENVKKLVEGRECDDDGNLPCEAWWKRRAFSIYRHAKEANAVWSVFITAAVMGLVIIGHKWQQERWQILHLKWQAGISRERMGWLLGPISRFKDVIAGGVHGPRSMLDSGSDSSRL